jgi:hypothetical protein
VIDGFTRRVLPRRIYRLALALCCVLAGGLVLSGGQALAAQAGGAPSIKSVSVSGVTEHDATLEAQINPNGLQTTYRFELFEHCPGICAAIWEVRLPAAEDLSSTEGIQSVSLDLNSVGVLLGPDQQYFFSVLASNAAGEAPGGGVGEAFQKEFLTPRPPLIDSESVTNISSTDATLNAEISTYDLYTAYEFQIDTNASYNYTKSNCPLGACQSITVGEPLPAGLVEPSPQAIPARSGNQSVSLDLASIAATLQPGTTYHYKVIASNFGGPTVQGPDQTFTTEPLGLAPLGVAAPSSTNGVNLSGTASTPPASGESSSTPGVTSLGPIRLATTTTGGRGLNSLTKAQKLAKALRACDKTPKQQRARCKKQVEKKYGFARKKGTG